MNSIEKFEAKLSTWSYVYCRDVEDDSLVRQYITYSCDAYLYCTFIKYREELAEIARQGGYDI